MFLDLLRTVVFESTRRYMMLADLPLSIFSLVGPNSPCGPDKSPGMMVLI